MSDNISASDSLTELLERAADEAGGIPDNSSASQSSSPARPAEGRVRVDAKPIPVWLDPRKTAVIVVDMQHGFFGAGGVWDRGGVDLSGAQAIVAPIARVIAAARQAGMPVVYVRVDFDRPWSDDPEDERLLGERLAAGWMVDTRRENPGPPRALPAGVADSDILPEVAPEPGDVVVSKTRHSGFYNTNLHEILQEMGIKALIFTGGTTSGCVESTLRDAFFRDYHCVLLSDCTAEPMGNRFARTNHDATLHSVEMVWGWVARSSAFIGALAENHVVAAAG